MGNTESTPPTPSLLHYWDSNELTQPAPANPLCLSTKRLIDYLTAAFLMVTSMMSLKMVTPLILGLRNGHRMS